VLATIRNDGSPFQRPEGIPIRGVVGPGKWLQEGWCLIPEFKLESAQPRDLYSGTLPFWIQLWRLSPVFPRL
jgi:hypothetical protein